MSWVFALPIGLPVLPLRADDALRSINPQPVEAHGWPAFVRQVTAVANTLPPSASISPATTAKPGR